MGTVIIHQPLTGFSTCALLALVTRARGRGEFGAIAERRKEEDATSLSVCRRVAVLRLYSNVQSLGEGEAAGGSDA